MKFFKLAFYISLTTSFFLSSCKHESELLPGVPEVCFETQVLPVIQSSCTMSGCHNGNNELFALNTYENLRSLVEPGKPMQSKLHKVITANRILENAMPPKPQEALSSSQIDAITIWILQGAAQTTCSEDCDTINVTFNKSILPITDTFCKGCHSGANPAAGISLTDYTSIKSAIEGGRFLGSIEHLQGFSAMPQNGNKLNSCNIVKIKKWISNGMPE